MNVSILMDKVKVRIEFRHAIDLDDEYRKMHEFKVLDAMTSERNVGPARFICQWRQ